MNASNNQNYVYLNAQNRNEYQRSLNLIDLQLQGLFKRKAQVDWKKGSEKSSSVTEEIDSSNSSEQAVLIPPKSLREIFEISNNNRKRNKQRKKSKLESCQFANNVQNWEEEQSQFGAAPPPTNVHQIIQYQYRHDC